MERWEDGKTQCSIKDKIELKYQSFHINFHHFASSKQFDDSYLFMYEYFINPLESLLMPQKFSFNNQRLICSIANYPLIVMIIIVILIILHIISASK